MSVNVDKRVVGPGNDSLVDDAWDLKERIRDVDGVLKQRKSFFTDAYRRSKVYAYLADETLIGFAAVRRDGYMLFLAVAPSFRGEGFGRRLVGDVAEAHSTVTCHARTTNVDALEFYEYVGFEVVRTIDGYYEDGGDAYYLRLGETNSITDKLSELMGR